MAAVADFLDEAVISVAGYEVNMDDELGRGAFGTVYRATNPYGQVVAAKKISTEIHKTATAKEIANYHKLCKLGESHGNIVKVECIRTQARAMWVFLEMCEYGDLNKFFERGMIGDKVYTALEITKQVTKGLEYLHSQNIIHRDLKPANILIKQQNPFNNTNAVKLSDFGLSKFLDPDYKTSAMSTDVGTTIFKAPEFFNRVLNQRLNYHRNVDVFAVGLTTLAMMQHTPGRILTPQIECPMDADCGSANPIGMIMSTRKRYNLPQVQFFQESVEDGFKEKVIKCVILDMLKFEPRERKSAGEINRDLTAFFNEVHRPVVATSLEYSYAAEQNEQLEQSNISMAGNRRVPYGHTVLF